MSTRLRQWFPPFLTFVSAVVAAAALGSLAQTQINLQALIGLGMTIELPLRLRSSLADLVNFAPLWALFLAVAFLLAFPMARQCLRWFGGRRWFWFGLAGAAAVGATLFALKLAFAITLISAARSWLGVALLCLSGAVGGLIQAHYGRRRN